MVCSLRTNKHLVGYEVRNDMLSLIYLRNLKVIVNVKTPVGDTDPILPTLISRDCSWPSSK